MSFLLATLNPGPKTRRRRHRSRKNPFFTAAAMKGAFAANAGGRRRLPRHRRKLSAWQRAVRKFGGVMQAVRAMRGRKHKHGKKRRSTVSRRSLRSRSRRVHGRRPKMARVRRRRHRRTPPRGAGGRFKSRHHRRHRRHRRNPVVPVSWSGNPGRSRRRRSHRRRRNPLFLSRRGFSRRKHSGYRRLHRRRKSPRYWHNPVLPFFAFNGKRRRKSGRRHHRRSRRSRYHRNPVLPFFAFNPGGASGDIMARMKSMIDVKFWTETALPVAGGFFGSKLIGSQVYSLVFSSGATPLASYLPLPVIPYVRLAINAVSGAGMAWAAEKFVSKKVGDGIWIGTIVGVASTLLKNLLDAFAPGVSSSLGLSGLAGLDGDISSQMKDAVVRRVQQNLGVYMTQKSLNRGIVRPSLSAYQTRAALVNATYDPSPRGNMSDYDVANTDTTL